MDCDLYRSMTDDQYVKMADDKLVLVKQKSCPVRTALHKMWRPVVMDPVSYAVLPGEEDMMILGSPTLAALRITCMTANGLSAGGEARQLEILDRHWTLFGAAFVATRLPVSSP